MNINVGSIDRSLRILAGSVLILLALINVIGPWGWIGIVAIATGVIRICPLYAALGLRTSAATPQDPAA